METGICYPYDSESLNERIKIREAIENGKIEKSISLINNLHPELIDNNRLLAFHLQVKFGFLNYKKIYWAFFSFVHITYMHIATTID